MKKEMDLRKCKGLCGRGRRKERGVGNEAIVMISEIYKLVLKQYEELFKAFHLSY